MSHAATNWAIRQRGLKPATKIVLWHLADRHNGDTGQCNPRQSRLAEDCEMSRSTLNIHLAELERRGLVKRITSIDPHTKRQRPTAYVLTEFEAEAESENRTRAERRQKAKAESENRTRAVSGKQPKPCPENSKSRVRNSDTKNPVREPGREPRASGGDVDASDAKHPIPVGSIAEGVWRQWLSARGHPELEVLTRPVKVAGEEVWLLPMRSPPDGSSPVGMGIVTKWIEGRA